MEFLKCDIAIIGGGASGLMAAAAVARSGKKLKTVIFEHHLRTGKKLMATGNGRCNLTNTNISAQAYFGSGAEDAERIISKYNSKYIIDYFEEIGLLVRTDSEGRVYPLSNHAASVLDCMRNFILSKSISEYCSTTVDKIILEKSGYTLLCKNLRVFAKGVVVACGGKASPKLSTNGTGYSLLKPMGIALSTLMPSLVNIPCSNSCLSLLKGLRIKGNVSLLANNNIMAVEKGEIQFANDALSGICVFQLSRMVNEFFAENTVKGKNTDTVLLSLDIMPEYTQQQCISMLLKRVSKMKNYQISNFFDGIFHKRIAQALYKECRINSNRKVADITKKEIYALANKLKNWRFTPSSPSSFENAQVTAGGVKAEEIDFASCESKKYKNLYIVGELVDVDGLCGGYNLHWAWCSGIMAGENIVNSISK